MQQIIKFFTRFKVRILFVILFCISIGLTIQSHGYHNSKWISTTSVVSAYFLNIRYSITSYFNLREENSALHSENLYLKKKLYNSKIWKKDSISQDSLYGLKTCNIITNSYHKLDNYVLIDKGKNDQIEEDYAVIIPNGILGIVEKSTENYARVISILNTNLSINAKIKNTHYFGSLTWDGKAANTLILEDLPRSSTINIGDTIVTGSNSLIFPKDIPIGFIETYKLDEKDGYYNINVKLFADMTNLNQAYIVIPQQIMEAKNLIP